MDPFAKQALKYALARPSYPQAILDALVERCGGRARLPSATAVDVGCGSGQLTNQLAALGFGSVLGVDRSSPQLDHAVPLNAQVRFAASDAHALPVPSRSVDLVAAAQALHWFDFDRFFLEARRALRPGGRVAVLGYARPEFPDDAKLSAAFDRYYLERLRSHRDDSLWEIDRRRVDSAFEGEEFEAHLDAVERVWVRQVVPEATAQSIVTYLETWSVYQKIADKHPLDEILRELRVDEDPDRRVKTVFPFYLVTGVARPLTGVCAASHAGKGKAGGKLSTL